MVAIMITKQGTLECSLEKLFFIFRVRNRNKCGFNESVRSHRSHIMFVHRASVGRSKAYNLATSTGQDGVFPTFGSFLVDVVAPM